MTKTAAAKSGRLTKKELKQDKLVEVAYKLEHYYLTHKNLVLGIGGGIVVAVIAVILLSRSLQSARIEESFVLSQAKLAYGQANLEQAKQGFEKVVADFSGGPEAEAHYFLGRIAFDQQNYQVAEKEFQTYVDDFSLDPYMDAAALMGLAATKDARGQFADAAKLYEQAAAQYPGVPAAPDALLAGSRLYGKLNQVDKQRELLTRIKEKYPDSFVMAQVRKELENLE